MSFQTIKKTVWGVRGFMEYLFAGSDFISIVKDYISGIPTYKYPELGRPNNTVPYTMGFFSTVTEISKLESPDYMDIRLMSNGDLWVRVEKLKGFVSLGSLFSVHCAAEKWNSSKLVTMMRTSLFVNYMSVDYHYSQYEMFIKLISFLGTQIRMTRYFSSRIKSEKFELWGWTLNGELSGQNDLMFEMFALPMFISDVKFPYSYKGVYSQYSAYDIDGVLNNFNLDMYEMTKDEMNELFDIIVEKPKEQEMTEIDNIFDLVENPEAFFDEKYDHLFQIPVVDNQNTTLFDFTEKGLMENLKYEELELQSTDVFYTSANYKEVPPGIRCEVVDDVVEIISDALTTALYKSMSIKDCGIIEDTSLWIEGSTYAPVSFKYNMELLKDSGGKKLEWVSTVVVRNGTMAGVVQQRLSGVCSKKPRGKLGIGFDFYFIPEGMVHTMAELKDKGFGNAFDIRYEAIRLVQKGEFRLFYLGNLKEWPGPFQKEGKFIQPVKEDPENISFSLMSRQGRLCLFEWAVKYGKLDIMYDSVRNAKKFLTIY
jgi:inosine/xanthosine triphosphate pyrophosphatase family protein